MDLRKKKTLRAIKTAFYALRESKNVEQISVTELTRKAEISKATFYLHYHDIFDLSEKLKQEVILSVMSRLEDPMELLTNSIAFMDKLVAALEAEKENVLPLFSGTQAAALPISLEASLKEYIFAHAPPFAQRCQSQCISDLPYSGRLLCLHGKCGAVGIRSGY